MNNLTRSIDYRSWPSVPVTIRERGRSIAHEVEAVIDTGSEITILDRLIAVHLGLDLGNGSRFNLRGFGGRIPLLGPAAVEIQLLGVPELTASVMAFFSENFFENFGNLLGLDVLESIDIGVAHRDRLLYFGLPR